MSADVLRRAAALMRERAEAATPGPWTHDGGWTVTAPGPDDWEGLYMVLSADHARNDGEHAASWHPAVAHAVADWLAMVADYVELVVDGRHPAWKATIHHAEAVARAYLGEDA